MSSVFMVAPCFSVCLRFVFTCICTVLQIGILEVLPVQALLCRAFVFGFSSHRRGSRGKLGGETSAFWSGPEAQGCAGGISDWKTEACYLDTASVASVVGRFASGPGHYSRAVAASSCLGLEGGMCADLAARLGPL